MKEKQQKVHSNKILLLKKMSLINWREFLYLLFSGSLNMREEIDWICLLFVHERERYSEWGDFKSKREKDICATKKLYKDLCSWAVAFNPLCFLYHRYRVEKINKKTKVSVVNKKKWRCFWTRCEVFEQKFEKLSQQQTAAKKRRK